MAEFPRVLVGIGWGALLVTFIGERGRRAHVVTRFRDARAVATARPHAEVVTGPIRALARRAAVATGPAYRVVRALIFRRRAANLARAVERELPVAIDLLGVAVGAGCTPYLALDVASQWSPPTIARSFTTALRACALGARFETALDDVARLSPRLGPLTEALLASERVGAPVGPALARLAAEERANVRRRAEAHARRVPVRLLFPLVFLVLPAFVLLTVVPGLAAGLSHI